MEFVFNDLSDGLRNQSSGADKHAPIFHFVIAPFENRHRLDRKITRCWTLFFQSLVALLRRTFLGSAHELLGKVLARIWAHINVFVAATVATPESSTEP